MKGKGVVLVISLLFCLLLVLRAGAQQAGPVESRAGRLTAAGGLGLQSGTADGNAFAMGFRGEYFLTHNISVGPLLQIGITGDLAQFGFTIQARYIQDIRNIPDLKPYLEAGIGFIHADLHRGFPDEHDTSFLIPFGFGAEYRLSQKLSLESTLLFNFTNLDDVRNEDFFITWLIGPRFYFR